MPPTSLLRRRLLAFGIDLVPLAVFGILVHLSLAQKCVAADAFASCAPDGLIGQLTLNDTTYWTAGSDLLLETLIVCAFFVAYRILLPAVCHATPGAFICGLRVVADDGGRATLRQHVRRTVGLLAVDSAPYIVPGIAGIAELVRSRGVTRLGDSSAGTRIVRRR
ncbi:MAG: RDD family protein [Mycobacteriales bacterium]